MNKQMFWITVASAGFVLTLGVGIAHADDLFWMADRVYGAGNYMKAQPLFEKALESGEGTAEQQANAYFKLGRCLHYANKTQGVITCFKAVSDSYPAAKCSHEARKWLGDCHVIENELDSAVSVYRALLNDRPDTSLARTTLHDFAAAQFKKKDYPAARVLFEEFLRLYPDHPLARSSKFHLRRIDHVSR